MRYWIVLLSLLILMSGPVYAYDPPDTTGYTKFKRTKMMDKGGDETKETLYEVWKRNNDYITSYSVNGKVYTWWWVNGWKKDPRDPNQHTIIDTDCDGVFDKKTVGPGYIIKLPECLK